ncbi:N-acetylglucosamine-6-phosphate deacetylase [Paenibacillus sp. J2TS4]|uniref:N-acetylglucosamine-6-phosphate deacetylase n=1 Tax=Paenibacillus sp. J2TS4 TaxID=2807194 RepID=UPI001B1A2D6C|nr:amidohydrolase family protein [Paenibacillus sp. J2TS4]GIP33658.1 N-acetylglucosamine-6-phosphate deacetylase [Paenibacillus sp. J2TS4]
MSGEGQIVLEGLHYETGKPVRVTIRGEKIQQVEESAQEAKANLPWIAPGLVDLQINGYYGVDFNTLPLTKEAVQKVTRQIAELGVTSYYPTVITNSSEDIEQLVGIIADACSSDPLTGQCIAGIHIEGPFISPEDGARGAHGKQFVMAPDWELFLKWQRAADGRIRIITLSPEWDNAPEFIAKCSASGVTVSIGHTSATPEQIRAAVAAGARMSTHLGNGAQLMLPRHPNYIWEQLASDELSPCAIADGFHLPESVLKVFLKAKAEQLIIVSDAVFLSGMAPGEYDTHIGGKVVLTPEGRLHTAANPNILAGSAQMLPFNIEHLVRTKLCTANQAWEMASTRPAAFMGMPAAQGLAEGAPADLVLYTWQGDKLDIHNVFKNGNQIHSH